MIQFIGYIFMAAWLALFFGVILSGLAMPPPTRSKRAWE